VFIANADALQAMLGIEVDGDALAIAEGLARRLGARWVALTRRELLGPREHGWSAVLYDAADRTFAQSRRHQVHVVDRVGGGDSFAAALIAQLLAGEAPARALEFAVTASALKLTVPGDFSRASVREIEARLPA
jgi:2-dehydro-3-deoxygluconokinase